MEPHGRPVENATRVARAPRERAVGIVERPRTRALTRLEGARTPRLVARLVGRVLRDALRTHRRALLRAGVLPPGAHPALLPRVGGARAEHVADEERAHLLDELARLAR